MVKYLIHFYSEIFGDSDTSVQTFTKSKIVIILTKQMLKNTKIPLFQIATLDPLPSQIFNTFLLRGIN